MKTQILKEVIEKYNLNEDNFYCIDITDTTIKFQGHYNNYVVRTFTDGRFETEIGDDGYIYFKTNYKSESIDDGVSVTIVFT